MRFVKEKKKKRPVFSVQQRAQYIRYKFLFFGTEVCQASAGTIRILLLRSCTGYRRNKNLLYVATHKFVSRTDFSKSGTVRKSLLLFETGLPFYPHRIKLVITFLRVISSTKYSDPLYQMQRIDHSSKFKLLPNSKCTGSVHCVDARGQRETISSAPEIPAPSPPLWIYCWS